MKAINFSLLDQDGKIHKLENYKGRWIVLYFYPKDDTPGCTKEACNFRDSFREIQKLGVQILGISKDSVTSHKKFAEKYSLNFPILSNEAKEVIKAYGAWGEKKFMGRTFEGTLRKTYLIDDKKEVRKIYNNVNPLNHSSEVVKDIKNLK